MKGTTEKAINQKEEFLSNVLGPSMRVGSPLMKNLLTSLGKVVLIPLVLKLVLPATDAATQKKIYGSVMSWRIWFVE